MPHTTSGTLNAAARPAGPAVEFPPFDPHPLVRNGHLQTIVGAYLPSPPITYRARRHEVPLHDGDRIVLHDDLPVPTPQTTSADVAGHRGWNPGDRVCLLIHGLCGSHQTGYMPRVAAKLNARGVRTFRMDLRGWGAGIGLARQVGHAGRSEDVAAALRFLRRLCPASPISVVAFSLGGNLVLKLMGETADRPPEGVDNVMAVGPPIDLILCSRRLGQGFSQVYDRAFTRALCRHYRRRQLTLPAALDSACDPRILRKLPEKLWDFDDQITAPLSGFRDARQYYVCSSAGPLLPQIRVPTLIVAAADDPLIPVESFERASFSSSCRLLITRHGGHLGFFGVAGVDPDRRWLDWRIIDWVCPYSPASPRSTMAATRLACTPRGVSPC